jgi:hypothetical protein
MRFRDQHFARARNVEVAGYLDDESPSLLLRRLEPVPLGSGTSRRERGEGGDPHKHAISRAGVGDHFRTEVVLVLSIWNSCLGGQGHHEGG